MSPAITSSTACCYNIQIGTSDTIVQDYNADMPLEPLLSGAYGQGPESSLNSFGLTIPWAVIRRFLAAQFKFLLIGFTYGLLVESAYVASIREGYVKSIQYYPLDLSVPASASNDRAETSTPQETALLLSADDRTSSTASEDSYAYYLHTQSWSDLFFAEMSTLFLDALFLIYVGALAQSIISKRRIAADRLNRCGAGRPTPRPNQSYTGGDGTLQLVVKAAFFEVGMVLGLAVAVSAIVGFQRVFQDCIWHVLFSMLLCLMVCIVGYLTACCFDLAFQGLSQDAENDRKQQRNQEICRQHRYELIPQQNVSVESQAYLTAHMV